MSNGVFEPGETTTVLCDLFPGLVTPPLDGVPSGAKLRVIVTRDSLTCAWHAGRQGLEPIIGRVDIPLTDAETAGVNHLGGQAGPYTITRGPGCSCGAAGLKNWQPFPDVRLVGATRYSALPNTGRYSRP